MNGLKAVLLVAMTLAWMLQMEHKNLVRQQIDNNLGVHHATQNSSYSSYTTK